MNITGLCRVQVSEKYRFKRKLYEIQIAVITVSPQVIELLTVDQLVGVEHVKGSTIVLFAIEIYAITSREILHSPEMRPTEINNPTEPNHLNVKLIEAVIQIICIVLRVQEVLMQIPMKLTTKISIPVIKVLLLLQPGNHQMQFYYKWRQLK